MCAFDKIVGGLAYPVFLIQWLAGFVTAPVFLLESRAAGSSRWRLRR